MNKSYEELMKLNSYEDRLRYLNLEGSIGDDTFGEYRYINQKLYGSYEWKKIRRHIITRDMGCEMGLEGYEIAGVIVVHHINPITKRDIENRSEKIFDPNNLICVSVPIHEVIHWGNPDQFLESYGLQEFIERRPNDHIPWKK